MKKVLKKGEKYDCRWCRETHIFGSKVSREHERKLKKYLSSR
jgi:hypothetical protein